MKKNEEAEDVTGRREKKTKKKSRRRAVETVEFAVPAAVGREERRGPIRARRGEIQAAVGRGGQLEESCPRRPRSRQYPPQISGLGLA